MEYNMDNITIQPLAQWETEEISNPGQLVWWSRLDGRYQAEVHRLDEKIAGSLPGLNSLGRDTMYQGVLCIFDHARDNELLGYEEVNLSYGAIFGPDVDDVHTWQEKTINFIDSIQLSGL